MRTVNFVAMMALGLFMARPIFCQGETETRQAVTGQVGENISTAPDADPASTSPDDSVLGGSSVTTIGDSTAHPIEMSPSTSLATDNRFYIGGGLFYAFNNFDTEGLDVDFDNTGGFNLKAGYFPIKYLALDLNILGTGEFKYEDSYYYYYNYYDEQIKVYGYSLTINAKGYPIADGMFRPFGLLGIGYSWGTVKYTFKRNGYTYYDYSESDNGAVFRFGGGLAVFIKQSLFVEAEAIYNKTTGDLEDAPFTQVGLNVCLLL